MTSIEINDQAQMVKISGHAGWAHEGKDIVCAGISALAWTLAAMLAKNSALNYVSEDDGELIIMYKALPGTEPLLDMFRTGAELLEVRYPENISVQGRITQDDSDNMNEKGGTLWQS